MTNKEEIEFVSHFTPIERGGRRKALGSSDWLKEADLINQGYRTGFADGYAHGRRSIFDGEITGDDTMTIDEAIEHAESRAWSGNPCAREHAQLASWLRELKELRKINE